MEEFILCPLCAGRIAYVNVDGTHIWPCSHCPFVGMEYYNENDIKALGFALNSK